MPSKAHSSTDKGSACSLFYSVDEAFLPLACISIASIVENRRGPLPSATVLLHDVEKPLRHCAEQFLETLGVEARFIDIDTDWCEPWVSVRRQSPAKFGILRLEEFIWGAADRVIVIDADTRFVDDIGPLLDVSLGSTPLAAVDDIAMIADGRVPLLANKLGLPPGASYFNSGLMVVDLERWTAERIGQQAIAVFSERPEILTFNDQCALNAVLQGRYTRLGFRWNHLVGSSPPDWPASMFHYAGHLKPWQLHAVRKLWSLDHLVSREHFDFYERMCAALQWPPSGFGRSGLMQSILMHALFIKLHTSGKLRRYSKRQRSNHIMQAGRKFPELLE